jgi:hypothetical protein
LDSDRQPPTTRDEAIETLRKRAPVNQILLADCRQKILGKRRAEMSLVVATSERGVDHRASLKTVLSEPRTPAHGVWA